MTLYRWLSLSFVMAGAAACLAPDAELGTVGQAATAAPCVKPIALPDRWLEVQTPPWDPDDTFDALDPHGRPLATPDIYVPWDQPDPTGYNAQRDLGLQIRIRVGEHEPGERAAHLAVALGGDSGVRTYTDNMEGCNTGAFAIGSALEPQPGNMAGPTAQGAEALIARDPNAFWDVATNSVRGSDFFPSPRIVAIPLYNPARYEAGGRAGRQTDLVTANFLGLFLEGIDGETLTVRVVPLPGVVLPD